MFERGVGFVMSKPSRFVDDFPETLLQPVSLVDEAHVEDEPPF
jgi:hypothetical protein